MTSWPSSRARAHGPFEIAAIGSEGQRHRGGQLRDRIRGRALPDAEAAHHDGDPGARPCRRGASIDLRRTRSVGADPGEEPVARPLHEARIGRGSQFRHPVRHADDDRFRSGVAGRTDDGDAGGRFDLAGAALARILRLRLRGRRSGDGLAHDDRRHGERLGRGGPAGGNEGGRHGQRDGGDDEGQPACRALRKNPLRPRRLPSVDAEGRRQFVGRCIHGRNLSSGGTRIKTARRRILGMRRRAAKSKVWRSKAGSCSTDPGRTADQFGTPVFVVFVAPWRTPRRCSKAAMSCLSLAGSGGT